MNASHLHVGVTDLPATVQWMEGVWGLRSTFRNDHMAVFPFGDVALIVDAAPTNTVATIAFDSTSCDEDVDAIRQRGGVVLEQPSDRAWGVRAAKFQGPGALSFEIEQASSIAAPIGEPGVA